MASFVGGKALLLDDGHVLVQVVVQVKGVTGWIQNVDGSHGGW